MLEKELEDKIKESIAVCDIHHNRLQFAVSAIRQKFPLDSDRFAALTNEELAFIDQLIYRFSKLQDIMGRRVFIEILQMLSEETDGLPFIDILNKLEKLKIIDSSKTWLRLRQARNTVTHEYPTMISEQIDGLNVLYNEVEVLTGLWSRLRFFVEQRI